MGRPLPPSGEDRVFAPPANPLEPLRGQGRAFLAVALGGAIGAVARWAVGLALPTPTGSFPLATFLINVVGCFLIAVVVVAVTELTQAHPLVRPFLATGILGGFTTFSTYSVDAQHLVAAGRMGTAFAYLGATLVAAVIAAWLGLAAARLLGRVVHPSAPDGAA
ncbi:MAG: fluoride efflux transporter CrcB [Pseudonocardia sp.]|uniref:fluoride efflux transporter CrcB n=1 Tax=unclassified Pseudonocardia TaxID=2619320 RepID=UPI000A917E4B|nr:MULTISPECIES: fluoride efflux transporter CrcB [unclassified Pseudonocardia]MBN9112671.1 fluoride efflux transporter CrcB [Pseudonocardia sp.]